MQKKRENNVCAAITRRLANCHTSQWQGILSMQKRRENDVCADKAFSKLQPHFPTAGNYRRKNDVKTTPTYTSQWHRRHSTQKPYYISSVTRGAIWPRSRPQNEEGGEQGVNLHTSRFKTGTLRYAFGNKTVNVCLSGFDSKAGDSSTPEGGPVKAFKL